MKKLREKNKGIAILFAVLVAVILISIATTITSIAIRQTILSSTGRESQYAFYAANTALECALYWDFNPPTGQTSPLAVVFPVDDIGETGATGDIYCDGVQINDNLETGWFEGGGTTTFQFNITNLYNDNKEYCAHVTVEKSWNSDDSLVETTITTKGYNNDSCTKTSDRDVERGLQLYYTY